MWAILGVFSIVLLCATCLEDEMPTVNIGQGTVIGMIPEDGEYFAFYGIPYADSTSGVHRFKVRKTNRHIMEVQFSLIKY